ncbi:hypothetical protein [Nocardia cyriacigeorgica]|uniref:DUF8176 domain-containing protein n=1 Tax=Nocardia cyriacigeorgica TaxID=135487 RepID=A0A6P1DFS0_9NOCA|nr:hypothetical protein [Nocardia cyriacigeorgica]NEW42531.1 hypothetical protein [Nocardia cyriacigeorgica]NEW48034.1 hypothetical protein [Nocardia cyriacigeorgica]
MTDLDNDDTDVAENPFDSGLPMLRTPPRPPRRRPTPPPVDDLEIEQEQEPDPEFEDEDQHDGKWQEWLDQPRLRIDSWDDDENLTATSTPGLVDRTGTPAARRRTRNREDQRRRRPRGVILGVGLAVIVAGTAALALTHEDPDTTETPDTGAVSAANGPTDGTPAPADVVSPVAELVAPGCVPSRSPELVVGVAPDGTGDAADLILGMQRAYYVQRSGEEVAAALAPGATATRVDGTRGELTADGIQRGIDLTPVGTRYCVQITSDVDTSGRWRVELTEQRPDQSPETGVQFLTVAATGLGIPLITAIEAG